MKDEVFRMLLDLWMVSDPWPLSDEDDKIFSDWLLEEANRRGWDRLSVAYHEFEVTP